MYHIRVSQKKLIIEEEDYFCFLVSKDYVEI